MKLTKNEIAVLVNYYDNLQFDLKDQIDALKENCHGVIDSDLYKIQLERYYAKYNAHEYRVNDLKAERNNL
nr:MAG TPA: hypothetical protein [Caudoviricetes sp.]